MNVAHQIHGAFPGAKPAVISGVGHLNNFEASAQFDAEVRDFCLLYRSHDLFDNFRALSTA